MVPYVRKSFYKHFKDGLKHINGLIDFNLSNPEDVSIDDDIYTAEKYSKAYGYAMDMTEREAHQGVEGLLHNLNTLQSRSGKIDCRL